MVLPQVVDLPADRLTGDAVAVFYFEDQRPLRGPAAVLDWRLDGQLTRTLLAGKLTGRAGEHAVFQNNHKLAADWSMFVGGGKWAGLCQETYRALIRHLLGKAHQAGIKNLAVGLPRFAETGQDAIVELVSRELEAHPLAFTTCQLSLVEGLIA